MSTFHERPRPHGPTDPGAPANHKQSLGTGFDVEAQLHVPAGRVNVGFITLNGRPSGIGIQTRSGTVYGVPPRVASSLNEAGLEEIKRWVHSSLYEGHLNPKSLFPSPQGSSTSLTRPSKPECIPRFPLKKFDLTIMQDYDDKKKHFFLYLEGFKEQRFFTSNRPIVLKDFDGENGPIRQALRTLPPPAIIVDLKMIPNLHPRAVLSWVVQTDGLAEHLPELTGAHWKDGKYASSGGRFGLQNTKEGGRFLADMLVGSFASGPHPLLSGARSVADRQGKIAEMLRNAGASADFVNGFKELLKSSEDRGGIENILGLVSGLSKAAPRYQNLTRAGFSSRDFRRPGGPSRPSDGHYEPQLGPAQNSIVPLARIPVPLRGR